jgi:hypothetical protein
MNKNQKNLQRNLIILVSSILALTIIYFSFTKNDKTRLQSSKSDSNKYTSEIGVYKESKIIQVVPTNNISTQNSFVNNNNNQSNQSFNNSNIYQSEQERLNYIQPKEEELNKINQESQKYENHKSVEDLKDEQGTPFLAPEMH